MAMLSEVDPQVMEVADQAVGQAAESARAKVGQVQAADQRVDPELAGAVESVLEAVEALGRDRERGTVLAPGMGQEREVELEKGRVVVPAEDRLPA